MNSNRHVLITGTGRAGTTFLVELLTNLGLDTGFKPNEIAQKKDKKARAGLEHNLRSKDCPYIVKDPWFCDYANEILAETDLVIEHIFIPVRDLFAAAESRRFVTSSNIKSLSLLGKIKYALGIKKVFTGGLWHQGSLKPGQQEQVLLNQLYKLLVDISSTNIPVTLLQYPKSVKDGDYLYENLKPILKDISYDYFIDTFKQTVQPELVHSFSKNDR